MENLEADNALSKEIIKLRDSYEELQTEVDELLGIPGSKNRSRIIGALTSAGVTAEKLLKYVIKNEGREKQLNSLDRKQQGLNAFKNIVSDILPDTQIIHLGTIIHWRNLVAHGNDIERVNENELIGVNAAIKSFVEWFFEDYLKGEYATEKLRNNPNPRPSGSTVQDEDKMQRVDVKKKKPSLMIWTILVLLIASTTLSVYYWPNSDASDTEMKPMTTDEAYDFISGYYDNVLSPDYNPQKYFHSMVSTFYTKTNQTPTDIEINHKLQSEYTEPKNSLDKGTLSLYSSANGISYWRFWNTYSCYRTSMKKYEKCRVLTEFGINQGKKITSIRELEVVDLKFFKKRQD